MTTAPSQTLSRDSVAQTRRIVEALACGRPGCDCGLSARLDVLLDDGAALEPILSVARSRRLCSDAEAGALALIQAHDRLKRQRRRVDEALAL